MCLFQLTSIYQYHSSFQRVKDVSVSFNTERHTYIIAYEQRGTQTEGILFALLPYIYVLKDSVSNLPSHSQVVWTLQNKTVP